MNGRLKRRKLIHTKVIAATLKIILFFVDF